MGLDAEDMLLELRRIALEAGDLIEKNKRPQRIEQKADSSFFTETDVLVNGFIVAELSRLYPSIPILAEESAPPPDASTFFAVDPLDGTREFIANLGGADGRDYSVMIGLVDRGRPVCGVVYLPARGRTYFAREGGGAHVSEGGSTRAIHVLPSDKIVVTSLHDDADLVEVLGRRYGLRLADVARVGGFGAKVCSVADGTYGAFVHTGYDPAKGHASLWDSCAPDIILWEAGGRSMEIKTGRPVTYRTGAPALVNGYIAYSPN